MAERRQKSAAAPIAGASKKGRGAAVQPAAERPWDILVWVAFGAHAAILALIVLSMTAKTHNLDDVKVMQYFVLGPILAIIALGLVWLKVVPLPPKSIAIGLAGLLAVTVISDLLCDVPQYRYRWIGDFYVQFNWIMGGFFLSAMCIACFRRTAEYFMRYMVIMWLTVNLIGLFMYNIGGAGGHSGVELLYKIMYPNGPSGESITDTLRLLATLSRAQNDMQSTILSRDFYAGICLLYMPFSMLLILDPGPSRRPNLWRAIGIAGLLLNLLSIFFCMSKGEYIFAVVAILFFVAQFYMVGQVRDIQRRHIIAVIGGLSFLIAMLLFLRSPMILSQLKGVKTSFDERSIMWGGAWNIFKAGWIDQVYNQAGGFEIALRKLFVWLFGSGPGTFRIYFPIYRRPDYYTHGISHVTTFSHNIFMDTLCELGILGTAALVLMLSAIWFGGLYWSFKHSDPRLRNILVACLTAMVGYLGSNLSSPNMRWVIGTVNVYTVMGFMTGIIMIARVRGVERPNSASEGVVAGQFGRQVTLWMATVLIGIGFIAWYFSAGTGLRYWNSAKDYADGLQWMEPAMEAMDTGALNRDTINSMLEKSCEPLERSIQEDPTNISAYYKLGSVYTTLYNFYIGLAEEARKRNPQQAEEIAAHAKALLDVSAERYKQLQEICPDYAQVHYNFGIVYQCHAGYVTRMALKETSKEKKEAMTKLAEDYLKRALDEFRINADRSESVEALLGLGGQYLNLNMDKEACATYAKAVKNYPKNVDAANGYLDAANALQDKRSFALALEARWHQDLNNDPVLDALLKTALTNNIEDVFDRTLDRMERMNPYDLRIYEYRMARAERDRKPQELLRWLGVYERAGGQGVEFYELAYKAAQSLGDSAQAGQIAVQIRQRHGTVPTSATTPAEAAPTTATGRTTR